MSRDINFGNSDKFGRLVSSEFVKSSTFNVSACSQMASTVVGFVRMPAAEAGETCGTTEISVAARAEGFASRDEDEDGKKDKPPSKDAGSLD